MKLDRDTIERVAAEYALGTLRGAARARFERLAARDDTVAAARDRWQSQLAPLDRATAAVTPPIAVWRAIEARLGLQANAPRSTHGAGWWRGVAVTLALTSLVLLAVLLLRPAAATSDPVIAVLAAEDGTPGWIVHRERDGAIDLEPARVPSLLPAQSFELWLLPPGAKAPRSLGVVAGDRPHVAALRVGADLRDGTALLISREPKGGAPGGAPTGPVLFKGVTSGLAAGT